MERSQESKGDGKMRMILVSVLVMVFAGCMSDREYMLRKQNADNAGKHPQTFEVLTIKGPVNIAAGAELTTRAATQPFQPLPVPDGIEAQRGIVRDVVTGAVIGYGLHQAGHNSTTKTTVTGEAAQ
jgi:hypothetical protein